MDYVALREKPRPFLALTSLQVPEFDDLLTDFAPAWERYHRWHTLEGKRRAFVAHRERPNAVLAGSEVKLFFLLTYLKNNSLQQHQAASFGISQARVSQLSTVLLAVLNQVLARRGLLPVRDGGELAQRLAPHPEPVFAYDGVERGVPRNQDGEAQAEEYSGKKKPTA
ncbi:helix-turn-helix domain-containing protein [Hymenobacter rubripertinctus]|uniref:Transposase family protein n=2 Tax=Hymenobacter rubripertinctus TaxID=2029981 RepID=A0A418QMM8_9BACT|nr:transposase family protein [Hymenobacter rubripertinctus]RIY06350.1 transposase family protein [Hymenobacter rubripertinctus]